MRSYQVKRARRQFCGTILTSLVRLLPPKILRRLELASHTGFKLINLLKKIALQPFKLFAVDAFFFTRNAFSATFIIHVHSGEQYGVFHGRSHIYNHHQFKPYKVGALLTRAKARQRTGLTRT